jgi:hypothetical protein
MPYLVSEAMKRAVLSEIKELRDITLVPLGNLMSHARFYANVFLG